MVDFVPEFRAMVVCVYSLTLLIVKSQRSLARVQVKVWVFNQKHELVYWDLFICSYLKCLNRNQLPLDVLMLNLEKWISNPL